MVDKIKMHKTRNQSGDTLVEVLLATVVLSIVLAGAFTMSTRALRFNQTATERTEVVNKMREQAEILQFINAKRQDPQFEPIWDRIENRAVANTPFYFGIYPANDPSQPVVLPETAGAGYIVDYNPATGEDSYGVADIFRIRVVPSIPASAEYIDFTIVAEWEGIGDVQDQRAANRLRLNNVDF